jgi:hypothetical protein
MAQGYTREQLIQMYGAPSSAPVSPAPSAGVSGSPQGFTRDQLIAQYGHPTDSSGNVIQGPVQNTGFVKDLQDYKPDYSGGLISDINQGVNDVGVGITKAATRLIPNLIQGLTPDKMWGDNSLLNSESPKANAFREATTGNSFLQKAGATAFDIAPILASGGASGAVTGATEVGASKIPQLASVLEQAGTAGKVARFATKIPGALMDTAVSNAIINKGEVSPSDNIGGTAMALALPPTLRMAGSALKSGLVGSEKYAASKAQDIFDATQKLAQSKGYNAVRIGEVAQEKSDFTNYIKDLITKKGQEKAIDKANIKTPSDDVLDFIYRHVGTLGSNVDGKLDTTPAVKAIEDNAISEISQPLRNVFAADKVPVSKEDFFNQVKKRILSDSKSSTGAKNADLAVLEEIKNGKSFINPKNQFPLENVSRSHLFDESQALRSNLNYARPLEKDAMDKNDAMKRVMRLYDDTLRGSVPGTSRKAIDEGFAKLTQYYDAIDVLNSLHGAKTPGIIGQNWAKAIGTVSGGLLGGPGAGGFIGNQVGYTLGPKINDLIGSSKFKQVVGNRTTQKIADLVQRQDVTSLVSKLEQEAANAASESTKTRTANKLKQIFDNTLKQQARKEAADSRMLKQFDRERKRALGFLSQLLEESKRPLGLPQGTMAPGTARLNVPSGAPQLPGPGVLGNSLKDYIGR